MASPSSTSAVDPGTTDRSSRPRLAGVDATRGVALLGMMAVHALFAADDAGDPTLIFSLSTGRAAAIFAVLAGVGVAFMTGRRVVTGERRRSAAASLGARAGVVGAIGLALGYNSTDYAAVILSYYAVLFLLAIPLVLLRSRALVAIGVLFAVGMPVLSHLLRGVLPEPELTNPSFEYLFADPVGLLVELSLTGYYPALPWVTYLCAGIVVGRLPLSSARTAGWLVAGGTGLAATAWLAGDWVLGPLGGLARLEAAGTGNLEVSVEELLLFGGSGTTPTTSWWWLATNAPHSSTTLDLLHTTGFAVALLGALLLLGHLTSPAWQWVPAVILGPLGAAGAMTLTIYTAHIIFMYSPLDIFGAVTGYVVQVVTAILFALAWRRVAGRGPLERLAASAARRAGQAAGRTTHAS